MAMPGKSGVQGMGGDDKARIPADPERPVMLHGFATASKNAASVHPLQEHLAMHFFLKQFYLCQFHFLALK